MASHGQWQQQQAPPPAPTGKAPPKAYTALAKAPPPHLRTSAWSSAASSSSVDTVARAPSSLASLRAKPSAPSTRPDDTISESSSALGGYAEPLPAEAFNAPTPRSAARNSQWDDDLERASQWLGSPPLGSDLLQGSAPDEPPLHDHHIGTGRLRTS